jgi:hypothetical protein
MDVFAFTGGVVPAERLKRDSVVVFDTMRQLPRLVGSRWHEGAS